MTSISKSDALAALSGGDLPEHAVRETRCLKQPIGCGQPLLSEDGSWKFVLDTKEQAERYEAEWRITGLCPTCQDANEAAGEAIEQAVMVCAVCETPVGWIDCPTGGWWAHETHPADGHDAYPMPAEAPSPEQQELDRLRARVAELEAEQPCHVEYAVRTSRGVGERTGLRTVADTWLSAGRAWDPYAVLVQRTAGPWQPVQDGGA